MTLNRQLVADLTYLSKADIPSAWIHRMHHMGTRRGSYDRMVRYFGEEHAEMTAKTNRDFAARVGFVANLHRRGVPALIELALKDRPLDHERAMALVKLTAHGSRLPLGPVDIHEAPGLDSAGASCRTCGSGQWYMTRHSVHARNSVV